MIGSSRPLDEARIRHEQIVVLHRQLKFVLWANIAASSIVGPLQAARTGGKAALIWWFWVMALTALRAWARQRSETLLGDSVQTGQVARRFFIGSLLSGCIWGTLGLIGAASDQPSEILFVTIVLAGMTAGSVASLSAYVPVYFAYAIPAMTPIIVRFALAGGSQDWSVAALGVVFLSVNLAYSRQNCRTLRDSIALRFEREELLRDLLLEKSRVEEASRAKTRFIAAISHDLRQPVHAIGLMTDALAHRPLDPEAKRLTAGIAGSLEGLDQLLGSFLDISKIEAGIVECRPRDFPLKLVFDNLARELHPLAHEKGLTLRVVPTAAAVFADPNLVARILRNLLVNAIRYTTTGSVLIGCRRLDGAIRVEVHDTGIGIAPERRAAIFEEFYRIYEGSEERDRGLGLGLAIAQGLAQRMEAGLDVRSTVGKGSVFSLTLPSGSVEAIETESAPAVTQGRGRILIVDDEPAILTETARLVASWGFDVVTAGSIGEALTNLRALGRAPDAAMIDRRLGAAESGDDLIQLLASEYGRPIPAAIITGDTVPWAGATQAPAHMILYKPVPPHRLRSTLSALLSPTSSGQG